MSDWPKIVWKMRKPKVIGNPEPRWKVIPCSPNFMCFVAYIESIGDDVSTLDFVNGRAYLSVIAKLPSGALVYCSGKTGNLYASIQIWPQDVMRELSKGRKR